jgi:hypothetical protein
MLSTPPGCGSHPGMGATPRLSRQIAGWPSPVGQSRAMIATDQRRFAPSPSILNVDATFVSLQNDPRAEDKAPPVERHEIVDLTARRADFAESCVDLLPRAHDQYKRCPPFSVWVSDVDSTLPDCRWLLDRDHSRWYPTAAPSGRARRLTISVSSRGSGRSWSN